MINTIYCAKCKRIDYMCICERDDNMTIEKENQQLSTAFEASRQVSEIQKAQIEALEQEVADYKEKEEWCSHCKNHPDSVDKLQKKIKKLTEMLRKCSPYTLDDDGGNSKAESICGFCGIEEDYNILGDGVHKPNCEYIAMTKED